MGIGVHYCTYVAKYSCIYSSGAAYCFKDIGIGVVVKPSFLKIWALVCIIVLMWQSIIV